MSSKLNGFVSNSVEGLLHLLKNSLSRYPSDELLPQKKVVIPSQSIKEYLKLELARESSEQVLLGVEFVYLNQALKGLQKRLSPQHAAPLSFREMFARILSYFLEKPLSQLAKEYPDLFNIDMPEHTRQKTKERLALKLAELFKDYHRYGKGLLESAFKGESLDWQVKLWRELFSSEIARVESFAYQADSSLNLMQNDLDEWFVFGWNFIPYSAHQLFLQASRFFSVSYFTLSPCQLFWLDAPGYKEQFKQRKFWESLNVSESEMEYAEDLLEDIHPMLLSMGGHGKHLLDWMERDCIQIQRLYRTPSFALSDPHAQTLLYDVESIQTFDKPPSLLGYLQTDLQTMQAREDLLDIDGDQSCQLHIAPSKYREVQVVYDIILRKLHEDPSLAIEDIQVVAPNIADYQEDIASVFAIEEEELPYHIVDPNILYLNRPLNAFLLWLKILAYGKADDLYALFRHEAICTAKKWSAEETALIQSWVDEQLKKFKAVNACKTVLHLQENAAKSAFSFLDSLNGIGFDGSTQATLVTFFSLIDDLSKDLLLVERHDVKTLKSWKEHLFNRFTKHFYLEYSSTISFHEYEACIEFLQLPIQADDHNMVTFDCVWTLYQKRLQNEIGLSNSKKASVSFSSILTQRLVPAKVLIMMGLEEGAFPRSSHPGSLDLAFKFPKLFDPIPKLSERDRYLFLEAILSCSGSIHFTCSNIDSLTNDPFDMVSPLVEELFHYMDKAYRIDGLFPSKSCVFIHPSKEYDVMYFQKGKLQSYSSKRYRLAEATLKEGTYPKRCFFKEDVCTELKVTNPIFDWSLQDALLLIKSPQEFYFRHHLRLRLNESRNLIDIDESEFILPSALENYRLKKEMWLLQENDFDQFFDQHIRSFSERLSTFSRKKAKEEYHKRQEFLNDIQVKQKTLYSLEAVDGYPERIDCQQRIYTSAIHSNKCSFRGIVEFLSPQANVLEIKKGGVSDLSTYLQQLFINLLKNENRNLSIAETTYLYQDGEALHLEPLKGDLSFKLEKLFHLLTICKEHCFPFPASAWPSLINEDFELLLKVLRQPIAFVKGKSWVNPYYQWTSSYKDDEQLKRLFASWSSIVSETFHDLKASSNASV